MIGFDSIVGGNIYASLEGTLEEPETEQSLLQLVTFHIGEWLAYEAKHVYDDYYQHEVEDWYLDPTDEDSTALGEVPQEAHKGVMPNNPIRPTTGKLGELFQCSMCVGFWVGTLLYGVSFCTELFTFELNVVNPFILGCISSGTSYILNRIFDDEGIKIKLETKE